MAKVFISHRRSDDPYAARGINDALAKRFGKKYVYFDLDAMKAGLDWRKQIDNWVAECNVMLVIIGNDWLQTDESGHSRLENEDDWVSFEVSAALKRDIPVIPVLVGKATIPDKESLPEKVRPLVYRQYVEVRATSDFNYQIEKLIQSIKEVVPEAAPPTKRLMSNSWARVILPLGVLVIVAGLAWQPLMDWVSKDEGTNTSANDIQKYALSINSEPADARIRFLSTGLEYQSGMMLIPGRYHVEVSGRGFVTQTQWLEIESHDLSRSIVLEPEKPEFVDGQVFKDCEECPEMMVIPAGSYVMGGSKKNEQPQHHVKVSSFAMGKYEVTFDEYDAFAHSTGKELPDDKGWGRGNRPVINISWDDISPYIDWLNLHTGKQYRLLSEAEWEYAARAGTRTDYWWGDEIKQDGRVWANCDGCGSQTGGVKTAKVGEFPANPFGLYDLHGNVWESVKDCGHKNYDNAPDDGSAWLEADDGECDLRVIRGGSWINEPGHLRSALRLRDNFRYDSTDFVGFRLAQDLPD